MQLGAMQTIVINNLDSLVIGQLPAVGKDTAGNLQLGGIVSLVPGVNLVDSAKLAVLRKNAAFEAHFKTKIGGGNAPEHNQELVGKMILILGKEVEDGSPLAKMKEPEAQAVIEETFTVGPLTEWLKMEGRGEVRRLIENQLLKIKGEPTGGPAAAGR